MAGRLGSYVHVNNTWYGPDDEVPEADAKLITNPKAWAEAPEDKPKRSAQRKSE